MEECTYLDNPEITGRGILLSFYLQGFLMALNGLLGIDKHELTPSFMTILAICGVLLYEVITGESVYYALVLHLLLCFHVLALHAVIVWVAEKSILDADRTNNVHPAPWRTWYRIAQLVGLVILLSSIYSVSYKECVETVEGFFLQKGFPIQWFLLLTFLPYAVSASSTWLLYYYSKKGDADQSDQQSGRLSRPRIHLVLFILWTLSLATVIIFLEYTIIGNRHRVVETGEPIGKWSLGQVLPLALAITPAWLFLRNVPTWFKQFKETQQQSTSSEPPDGIHNPNEWPVNDITNPHSLQLEYMASSGNVGEPAIGSSIRSGIGNVHTENVHTMNTGFFLGSSNIAINNGTFVQVTDGGSSVNYREFGQRKVEQEEV